MGYRMLSIRQIMVTCRIEHKKEISSPFLYFCFGLRQIFKTLQKTVLTLIVAGCKFWYLCYPYFLIHIWGAYMVEKGVHTTVLGFVIKKKT